MFAGAPGCLGTRQEFTMRKIHMAYVKILSIEAFNVFSQATPRGSVILISSFEGWQANAANGLPSSLVDTSKFRSSTFSGKLLMLLMGT